jgi:hypothetical protein
MTEAELMDLLARRGQKTAKTEKIPKYKNKKTWVDGICFDSQKEANYYYQLKFLLRAGKIKGFCLQPKFVLVEGNEKTRAITYSADFIIFNNDGSYRLIDTKGFESEQWKRTFKQFRLKYPELELEIVK